MRGQKLRGLSCVGLGNRIVPMTMSEFRELRVWAKFNFVSVMTEGCVKGFGFGFRGCAVLRG